MSAFANWATIRPFRVWLLVLLCLVLVPPLAFIAPALLALNALRHGPVQGLLGAAVTIGSIAALGQFTGTQPVLIGLVVSLMLIFLLPAAAGGAVLAWSRDLSTAYQSVVTGTMLVIFVVFATMPRTAEFGAMLLQMWEATLRDLGIASEELAVFSQVSTEDIVSLLLGGTFIGAVAGLVLGFWWFTLIREGIGFGAHFRDLRLGRYASLLLMAVLILARLVTYPPLAYLAPLALVGFLFPGFAVMHARARNDHWHVGVLIAVYVLLFFPITTGVVVLGLSAAGLLDNFFNLRGRARSAD